MKACDLHILIVIGMAAVPKCQSCASADAKSICSCGSTPTPLCSQCLTIHSSSNPYEVHTLFPMTALRWMHTPGYMLRLQHRKERSGKAIEELTDNVKRLEYCHTVFVQRVEMTIEMLQMYRDQTVEMLGRYKRDLAEAVKAAVEEANEHIFDEEYSAENAITAAILNYNPGKLTLFTYEMTAEGRLIPKLATLPKRPSRFVEPSTSSEPSFLLPLGPPMTSLPLQSTEQKPSIAAIEEPEESQPPTEESQPLIEESQPPTEGPKSPTEEQKEASDPVEETLREEIEGPLSLPNPTLIAKTQIGGNLMSLPAAGKVEDYKEAILLVPVSPSSQLPPPSLSVSTHISAPPPLQLVLSDMDLFSSSETPNSALIPPPNLPTSISSLTLSTTSWTPLPFKISKESMTMLSLAVPPSERELRYSSPVPLTRHSAIAVVTQDSLLVCGGDDPLTDAAVSLNFNNGVVTNLKHMNVSRYAHGIAVYGACVYVFGGKNAHISIAASERYRRKGKDWEQMPQMITPRSFFNPCVVGQIIYLIGGAETNRSETFDIVGLRFTEVKLDLPVPGATSAFILHDDLVILQTGKASRIKANLKGALQVYDVVDGNRSPWGNMAPLLLGSDILIGQCFSEQVLRIDSLAWSAHIYS